MVYESEARISAWSATPSLHVQYRVVLCWTHANGGWARQDTYLEEELDPYMKRFYLLRTSNRCLPLRNDRGLMDLFFFSFSFFIFVFDGGCKTDQWVHQEDLEFHLDDQVCAEGKATITIMEKSKWGKGYSSKKMPYNRGEIRRFSILSPFSRGEKNDVALLEQLKDNVIHLWELAFLPS